MGTDNCEQLRRVATIHAVIWKSSECYGSQITKNREEESLSTNADSSPRFQELDVIPNHIPYESATFISVCL